MSILKENAARHARTDGWAYLAQAGALASKSLDAELQNYHELYGIRTLREIAEVSGLFEVKAEALPGGNSRVIYRRLT